MCAQICSQFLDVAWLRGTKRQVNSIEDMRQLVWLILKLTSVCILT